MFGVLQWRFEHVNDFPEVFRNRLATPRGPAEHGGRGHQPARGALVGTQPAETIKAVTGVSAGHGLDREVRPKGLEPLTF
ncbi:hypothetical protein ACIBM8_14595 [Micromonospora aurantiaca]|uniref:hypothetical protein n=1 Tax=Micromonospora aurantiaca (nom. illeg.) TaxID=47850 RepID=UPI003797998B